MEGYANGVWINGYHWYDDPFNIYSNYSIDHFLEITGELNSFYNPTNLSIMAGVSDQENMYFLYSIINSNQDLIPVPEPSSFFLLLTGAVLLCIVKHFLKTNFL